MACQSGRFWSASAMWQSLLECSETSRDREGEAGREGRNRNREAGRERNGRNRWQNSGEVGDGEGETSREGSRDSAAEDATAEHNMHVRHPYRLRIK